MRWGNDTLVFVVMLFVRHEDKIENARKLQVLFRDGSGKIKEKADLPLFCVSKRFKNFYFDSYTETFECKQNLKLRQQYRD